VAEVGRALALFVLAGLAEIGGGWLVWQFLRESRPWPFGLLGSLVLISYGVIVTFQADPHFGRVYAAYGGIFIVMALTWGYAIDGFRPDRSATTEAMGTWPMRTRSCASSGSS
jgi:small multidrug resistance family-3 protein